MSFKPQSQHELSQKESFEKMCDMSVFKKELRMHTYSVLRRKFAKGKLDTVKVPKKLVEKRFQEFCDNRPEHMKATISYGDLDDFLRDLVIEVAFDYEFKNQAKALFKEIKEQLPKHVIS